MQGRAKEDGECKVYHYMSIKTNYWLLDNSNNEDLRMHTSTGLFFLNTNQQKRDNKDNFKGLYLINV